MAGVGEHSLTYTFVIEATSCVGYDTTTIIVNALPEIEISALDDVCEDAEPFILNIATPEGGTYSGNGVSSGTFNPSMPEQEHIGLFTLTQI